MLNAGASFNEVVREARAVVLAGGTMQPFNLFTDQVSTTSLCPASH
jgi:Rad3-related DNA helicase